MGRLEVYVEEGGGQQQLIAIKLHSFSRRHKCKIIVAYTKTTEYIDAALCYGIDQSQTSTGPSSRMFVIGQYDRLKFAT